VFEAIQLFKLNIKVYFGVVNIWIFKES